MSTAAQQVTSEQRAAIIAVLNSERIATVFWNLRARWADESEHEDIRDYSAPLRAAGLDVLKMSKRPFGAFVLLSGRQWHITGNARRGTLRAAPV